jgi:hypothetical protein
MFPSFLTSALVGGEWSVSRPGRFIPRERAPGTHWIGSWVRLRAGLDGVEKTEISFPSRESNPGRPAPYPFAVPSKLFRACVFRMVLTVNCDCFPKQH